MSLRGDLTGTCENRHENLVKKLTEGTQCKKLVAKGIKSDNQQRLGAKEGQLV